MRAPEDRPATSGLLSRGSLPATVPLLPRPPLALRNCLSSPWWLLPRLPVGYLFFPRELLRPSREDLCLPHLWPVVCLCREVKMDGGTKCDKKNFAGKQDVVGADLGVL